MTAVPRRLPPAVADIIAAAEWYDDQLPGLGDEFVREVNVIIESLSASPLLHRIRFEDVRCARLQRFKDYGVFFFLWEDEVIVFAVFHGRRHPGWLRQRRRSAG